MLCVQCTLYTSRLSTSINPVRLPGGRGNEWPTTGVARLGAGLCEGGEPRKRSFIPSQVRIVPITVTSADTTN